MIQSLVMQMQAPMAMHAMEGMSPYGSSNVLMSNSREYRTMQKDALFVLQPSSHVSSWSVNLAVRHLVQHKNYGVTEFEIMLHIVVTSRSQSLTMCIALRTDSLAKPAFPSYRLG